MKPGRSLVFLLLFFGSVSQQVSAQQLKPGFNKSELREALLVNMRTGSDSAVYEALPEPEKYTLAYESDEVGLLNVWALWLNDNNNTGIISIRGTVPAMESWLANFYAAMVPAKGELILSEQDTFKYQLAENQKAAVHIGWLISTAYLYRDMLPKIDSVYQEGIKDFIITGHSQGGGISYLLTAYLVNLQKYGDLPEDINFKTYSTAAPKPGNLYFAYDYEQRSQNG